MRRTAAITLLVATSAFAAKYSTCPKRNIEEAASRSVAYSELSTTQLAKRAKKKILPSVPPNCRCNGTVEVTVTVFVEGNKTVCASADNGHPLLQKAAVDAASKWTYREELHNSTFTGKLIFGFENNHVRLLNNR
jgi:hypothetical protein